MERKIRGYAIVFDSPSEDLGGFVEVVDRHAVDHCLAQDADIRALFNHDYANVLGRTKAGTLGLKADDRGLSVTVAPPDTGPGRDVVVSLARGDIDGMSFGFKVVAEDWSVRNGKPLRKLLDIDLFEVSIVARPAYPATTVGVEGRTLARVTPRVELDDRGGEARPSAVLTRGLECIDRKNLGHLLGSEYKLPWREQNERITRENAALMERVAAMTGAPETVRELIERQKRLGGSDVAALRFALAKQEIELFSSSLRWGL